jgi:hypothetical protein
LRSLFTASYSNKFLSAINGRAYLHYELPVFPSADFVPDSGGRSLSNADHTWLTDSLAAIVSDGPVRLTVDGHDALVPFRTDGQELLACFLGFVGFVVFAIRNWN